MNISEFDSSEFDYLNADNYSQSEAQTVAKTPEVSDIERFWNLAGNWGEFGSYFGTGLSASLIVRAIPVLIPSAVILIPAAGLSLVVFTLASEGTAKLRSQLILIAVGTALLSANWDAWLAWTITNSQLLFFTAALLITCSCFVITQAWSKLNVRK
jgi:hypothetical protein